MVTRQLQVEHRSGKVRRSKTNVLPRATVCICELKDKVHVCIAPNRETTSKGVFIATQLNSTQLNWPRWTPYTAKSVVFLFMTSRPTNWVNWVTSSLIDRSWVQLSSIELCRYKRALRRSDMDRTVLHANIPYLPSSRKRSPDGATTCW